MKYTKKYLLSLKPNISGFGGSSAEDVGEGFADYESRRNVGKADSPVTSKHKILYADYTAEGYEGSAYVFGYDTDVKKFFEVFGSHCSCYGLEGQWGEEYFDSLQILAKVIHDRFVARDESNWYRPSDSKEFEAWLKSGLHSE